ncbi:MAG: hypothetical protein AAF416_04010 [Pseudomonadota bacterium]
MIRAPKPDRTAFARRYTVPLVVFFAGCLALGLFGGNVLAILGGVGGLVWLGLAHWQKPER